MLKLYEVVLCDAILKPLCVLRTATSVSSAIGFLATSDFKVVTGSHIMIREYKTQTIHRIYRIQSMAYFEKIFTFDNCL